MLNKFENMRGKSMKNKYFGDVGDFGKYALLSMILRTGFSLEINWYLTEDDNSTDGKFVEYFDNKDFSCDEELRCFLHECILHKHRDVRELRSLNRFSEAPVFEDVLQIKHINALSEAGRKLREVHRKEWFEKSLKELGQCDIIFCDPDNGIETKSLSKTSKDSVKYVFIDEIERVVNTGHSVIVYNHGDRSKEEDYKERFKEIYQCVSDQTQLKVIRYNRYSVRDYLFFIQNEHQEAIERQINLLIKNNNWNKLFSKFIV